MIFFVVSLIRKREEEEEKTQEKEGLKQKAFQVGGKNICATI